MSTSYLPDGAVPDPLWVHEEDLESPRSRRLPTLFWIAPLWLLIVADLRALREVPAVRARIRTRSTPS